MSLLISFKNVVASAVAAFNHHRITEKSAALAYYALFALSPILILVTSVASMSVFGSLTQAGIEEFFVSYFGPSANTLLERALEGVSNQSVNIAVAVVGSLLILFAATGFFRALQRSLHEIFSVSGGERSAVRNILNSYLYSIGYLIVFLFFVIFLFVAQYLLTTSLGFVEGVFSYSISSQTIRALTAVLMLVLLTLFLGSSFWFFSKRTVSWGDSLIGGFAASILVLTLNNALGLYFAFSEALVLYGAAGFLVAILLWMYVFFMILFSGALIARYVSRL